MKTIITTVLLITMLPIMCQQRRCMYHPTELYLNFLPGEIKKSNISLLELKKGGYVKDLDSIYKIQLHCVVYSWTFKRDDNGKRNKELYEKEYTFYWE